MKLEEKQIPDTSTTLLRDVADSQHARWAVFYSRYQPMMAAYLRERFPALDADDIIQETFAALVRILPGYTYDPKEKGAFHNYLTGVLRNKALCALDKRRRKMDIEKRMEIEVSASGKSPSEQSYLDWREAIYKVALQQLLADESIQERTKQVFLRVAVKGESPESVGESLGIERNAVNQIKKRMVDKLHCLVENLKSVC